MFGLFKKKNIHDYKFPEVIIARTKQELNKSNIDDTVNLLKSYLQAHKDGSKLEMAYKDADVLWHNFILDTRAYAKFCNEYVGHFVHHVPYLKEKALPATVIAIQDNVMKMSSRKRGSNSQRGSRTRHHEIDTDDGIDLIDVAAVAIIADSITEPEPVWDNEVTAPEKPVYVAPVQSEPIPYVAPPSYSEPEPIPSYSEPSTSSASSSSCGSSCSSCGSD